MPEPLEDLQDFFSDLLNFISLNDALILFTCHRESWGERTLSKTNICLQEKQPPTTGIMTLERVWVMSRL